MAFLETLLARYAPMRCIRCGSLASPRLGSIEMSTHHVPAIEWACSDLMGEHWRRIVAVEALP